MAHYPLLATVYYKDRNINVKVPVRIKKIKMVDFGCLSCKQIGGLKTVIKWCDREEANFKKNKIDLKWEYDEERRIRLPRAIVKSESEVLCPVCFLDGKTQICDIDEKYMFKAYTTASPEFIDATRIVKLFVDLKWKTRIRRQNEPPVERKSLEAFTSTANELMNAFKNILKPKLKKGCVARIKINKKLTEAELDQCLTDYEKRKVIDRL